MRAAEICMIALIMTLVTYEKALAGLTNPYRRRNGPRCPAGDTGNVQYCSGGEQGWIWRDSEPDVLEEF